MKELYIGGMTKIEPALTAEEWAELGPTPGISCNWGEHIAAFPDDPPSDRAHGLDIDDDRHAIAAVALYAQPFGFTRKELEHLTYIASHTDWKGLLPIIQKIEALLPPE